MFRERFKYLRFPVIAVGFAALAAYCMTFLPAQSQITSSGPLASTVNQVPTTTALQIIAANPSRRFLTICNVGVSTTYIAPLPMVATTSAGLSLGGFLNTTSLSPTGGSLPLSPPNSSNLQTSPPTCYNTPNLPAPGGGIGAAWNALSVTTFGVLTILEY